MKNDLEALAKQIESKLKPYDSSQDVTIIGLAGVDSYNKALTEAAAIVRGWNRTTRANETEKREGRDMPGMQNYES